MTKTPFRYLSILLVLFAVSCIHKSASSGKSLTDYRTYRGVLSVADEETLGEFLLTLPKENKKAKVRTLELVTHEDLDQKAVRNWAEDGTFVEIYGYVSPRAVFVVKEIEPTEADMKTRTGTLVVKKGTGFGTPSTLQLERGSDVDDEVKTLRLDFLYAKTRKRAFKVAEDSPSTKVSVSGYPGRKAKDIWTVVSFEPKK